MPNKAPEISGSADALASERALIACAVHAPLESAQALLSVSVDSFARLQHRHIWKACQHLAANGGLDEATLQDYLDSNGLLEKMGGLSAFLEITDVPPDLYGADRYAAMVVYAARSRKLQYLSGDLARAIAEHREIDAEDLIQQLYDTAGSAHIAAASGFRIVHASSLEIGPPKWLLPGLLEAEAMAALVGPMSSGKSFLAIDWSIRVAERGHAVIYLAGEGLAGFSRRLEAWRIVNRTPNPFELPLHVSTGAISVATPAAAQQLRKAVSSVAEQHGPPGLIVMDTLARHSVGIDENSPEMGAVIAALDDLKLAYGCTALIVHHTGHGAQERARGHSSIEAALDAEYIVTRTEDDKTVRVTCRKLKESELLQPFAFKQRSVELDLEDEQGNPVTSSVLEPTDWSEPPDSTKGKREGKHQRGALAALQELSQSSAMPDGSVLLGRWRDALRDDGLDKGQIYRVIHTLRDNGSVVQDGDYVRLG